MTTIKTYEKQLIKHLPASAAPIPIESDLKIVVSLKTPNLDSTRTTAETCADLLKSPPTRPEAVERLVATFRPEIRDRTTATVADDDPKRQTGRRRAGGLPIGRGRRDYGVGSRARRARRL